MNRFLSTVRKAGHALAFDPRSALVHHTMEHGWGMADRGNRLAGIEEGLDQSDGIGIIDQIPHWPVAAHIECEVSASLRNGAVLFANRGGPGSVSQVFRKQGIDIVADTASTMASF